jgi:uncharacterized protein YukE
LDLSELNRSTSGGVLRLEPMLRGLLATFVIVGLLGTLFGIARAVAVFGGDEPSAKDLLQRLPGAFTPSIWGVSFSILGSLLLVFTRSRVSDFSNNLRAKTQEVLVPKLLPSRSQKLDQAASKALATSQRIVEFAESIEGKSAELDLSLKDAASYAQTISTAMQGMSGNIKSASDLVDKSLATLNDKILVLSGTFDRIAVFCEAMDLHEARVTSLLQQFKELADSNASVSGDMSEFIRKGTSDLLSATRELYKPVRESATEIAKTSTIFTQVCEALITELTEVSKEQTGVLGTQFSSWRVELDQGATAAKRSLDNLKVPFEQSAERLREQSANSIHQMSTLLSELSARGTTLVSSLSDVVDPLRQLAAREVSQGRTGHGSNSGIFGTSANGNLDTRLKGLEDAIRDFASATRGQRRPGFLKRLFRRK